MPIWLGKSGQALVHALAQLFGDCCTRVQLCHFGVAFIGAGDISGGPRPLAAGLPRPGIEGTPRATWVPY